MKAILVSASGGLVAQLRARRKSLSDIMSEHPEHDAKLLSVM
jgi:hypothetical protein